MVTIRILRDAWTQRRLLAELVRRDVRGRYAGSRFGLLWSILNPLVQLVSYGTIFSFVYGAKDGESLGALLATLFCGLWAWWAFSEGTMRGLTSLVDQAALLKRAPLPPAVCVLSAVVSSFLLQTVGFLVFLSLFALAGLTPPRPGWLALPLALGLGLALSCGVALAVAPLYLVVRDTVHVVTALLTVAFFASPVLYQIDVLPESVRGLAALNPIAAMIGLYRAAVLDAPLPGPASLAVALLVAAGGWALGGLLLGRLEGLLDEYW